MFFHEISYASPLADTMHYSETMWTVVSSNEKGETRRNRLGALIPEVVVCKEIKRRGGDVED